MLKKKKLHRELEMHEFGSAELRLAFLDVTDRTIK